MQETIKEWDRRRFGDAVVIEFASDVRFEVLKLADAVAVADMCFLVADDLAYMRRDELIPEGRRWCMIGKQVDMLGSVSISNAQKSDGSALGSCGEYVPGRAHA